MNHSRGSQKSVWWKEPLILDRKSQKWSVSQESNDVFNPLQWWLENKPWERDRVTGLTGLRGSSRAYALSHWVEKFVGSWCLHKVPALRLGASLTALVTKHFIKRYCAVGSRLAISLLKIKANLNHQVWPPRNFPWSCCVWDFSSKRNTWNLLTFKLFCNIINLCETDLEHNLLRF